MDTGSSRRELLGSIMLIATMSFLAGTFLMSGLRALTGGGWEYIIQWALIPFLVLVAILHARKILNSC
jgi:membrane protein implicated in regulation of membrane protease activity